MRIEFDKIGQGCDYCAAKPSGCPTCERNPGLLHLKDNFKRIPKIAQPPKPGVKDDSLNISEANRKVLAEFGIHPPAPPSDQQKPTGENGPSAGSQG